MKLSDEEYLSISDGILEEVYEAQKREHLKRRIKLIEELKDQRLQPNLILMAPGTYSLILEWSNEQQED